MRHPSIPAQHGPYLAFLAKFPGATTEALRYLKLTQANPFGSPVGTMPKASTLNERLGKLKSKGVVQYFTNPVDGVKHFGLTKLGISVVELMGYDIPAPKTLDGIAISRLTHFSMVALVAAQLISPMGVYREHIHSTPVSLDSLVSEQAVRESANAAVKKIRANNTGDTTLHEHREQVLTDALQQVADGYLDLEEMVSENPLLLTLTNPPGTGVKRTHTPDMAILLDPQLRRIGADRKAQNIMVEVELSRKHVMEYKEILTTVKAALDDETVYAKVVYFVANNHIRRQITKADKLAETDLIRSGELVILDFADVDTIPDTTIPKPAVQHPTTIQEGAMHGERTTSANPFFLDDED